MSLLSRTDVVLLAIYHVGLLESRFNQLDSFVVVVEIDALRLTIVLAGERVARVGIFCRQPGKVDDSVEGRFARRHILVAVGGGVSDRLGIILAVFVGGPDDERHMHLIVGRRRRGV